MSITQLTIAEIVDNIGELTLTMTPQEWEEILVKVWTEGTEDDAKRFLENNFEYLKNHAERDEKNQVQIFGEASADDVVDATNRAAARIANRWKEIEANNKQRGRHGTKEITKKD